jgi:hypothetical protein
VTAEVRPRAGWVVRKDGTEVALRFVQTEDPTVFLAVTVDGEPVGFDAADSFRVDVIGPGQSVVFGRAAGDR